MSMPLVGPIPILGLGTWDLRGKECEHAVKEALKLGYTHIDTAIVYENHASIAKGIAGFDRSKLFITSKIFGDDIHPENVQSACEGILNELKTHYLDLLLIHWPDKIVQMEKTLEQMVILRNRGLIQNLGVSNFAIKHLKKLESYKFPILNNQVELHPYLQQDELQKYCAEHHISVTAYRPIRQVWRDPVLKRIGDAHGKSTSQVALRWFVQKGIVAIPKATSQEHLKENIEIFDFELSPQEMQAIHSLDRNERSLNPSWGDF